MVAGVHLRGRLLDLPLLGLLLLRLRRLLLGDAGLVAGDLLLVVPRG